MDISSVMEMPGYPDPKGSKCLDFFFPQYMFPFALPQNLCWLLMMSVWKIRAISHPLKVTVSLPLCILSPFNNCIDNHSITAPLLIQKYMKFVGYPWDDSGPLERLKGNVVNVKLVSSKQKTL